MYDIIPDIHGQAGKLILALTELGYTNENGAWRHSDPERRCVFLGDYIDRGPNNAAVIDIVRRMVDAGSALAILGNHELNAIHYHTIDPESGRPLRPHSDKNTDQHKTFLDEFPAGQPQTQDVIEWMMSLPLFIELDEFRVVHACWDDEQIAVVKEVAPDGVLSRERFIEAGRKGTPMHQALEIITKGPEYPLPDGGHFLDKDGNKRTDIRVRWWARQAKTLREIAASMPETTNIPDSPIPDTLRDRFYPDNAKPVFFGHYWLTGTPELQATNALCLDYSAGKEGEPLASYRWQDGDSSIKLQRITLHR